MPTILLIRHGENDLVGKGLAGRLPGVHLNEKGRGQAMALAGLLAKAPITALYSSPLERALETAAPLGDVLRLPVEVRPGLVEVDYGEWQGMSFKQLHRLKLWKQVKDNPAQVRFPGGESIVEVQQRVSRELADIFARHTPEDMIACFTHGDIIRLAVAHYLNMAINDFQRLAIHTASMTVLELADGRPRLLHINQLAALEWPQKKRKTRSKRSQ